MVLFKAGTCMINGLRNDLRGLKMVEVYDSIQQICFYEKTFVPGHKTHLADDFVVNYVVGSLFLSFIMYPAWVYHIICHATKRFEPTASLA